MSKQHKIFALSFSSLIVATILLSACTSEKIEAQDPDAFRKEMEAQREQRERDRMIRGIH